MFYSQFKANSVCKNVFVKQCVCKKVFPQKSHSLILLHEFLLESESSYYFPIVAF